ncbi:hypothetical protein Bca4012_006902 [Brassica carinata]|uniref:KIB1-4 beta-propeller domain-containing protein n=1 Tax=Brassica carinata TaxID=52824 RepID=A0A8X7RMR2_BRACI|nr:hypothetical protein Bca52824_037629 [Brassica carinata]
MPRLLFKLSPLIYKSGSVRTFSSSTTGPYTPMCMIMSPSPNGNVGEALLFNVDSCELVRSPEKAFPKELYNATLVGTSRGWGMFSNRLYRSAVISDFLNPYASKSEPKVIPLPPFTTIPTYQTEVVCNMAMSSSPEPYDKDRVVGIKFLGKQLSFCRPHLDLRWTNIPTPFESWDTSKLMYSKKDQRFNLLAPGGNYLCSWDHDFNKDKKPKFHELVLHNLPSMPREQQKRLDSNCREDHWVESPSGESFLVKWFSEYTPEGCKVPMVMVFREEDTKDGRKNMHYTDDIGDMCIFISKSEDFCVKASSFRGLNPNSIFLNGRLFVSLNMSKFSCRLYEYPEDTPYTIPYSPYRLPPFSSY